MQRRFRLTRSEDFQRARQHGKSYAHPLLVLIVGQNSVLPNRLRVGVTAGKTAGSAVKRNRAKRLLREAMRPLLPSLLPGNDLILIARPALTSASLEEARAALLALLRRASLVPVDESRN